ncbi:MAG TPA: efflux RND transporter periplasmic adaptor subunit, partial [Thermoanaerobaculia bacterium]
TTPATEPHQRPMTTDPTHPEPPAAAPPDPSRSAAHKRRMALVAVVVVATGALVAFLAVRFHPEPERHEPEVLPPVVETVIAMRQPVALDVRSQGTVEPRTESELVAQVAGRIVAVDDSFADGGFFRPGEVLVAIDPRDYELALADARAAVAQAETLLAREEAEAAVARQEWEELGRGEPSPLVLRVPQVTEARARVAAARAAVERAGLELARTRVTAPFPGRVRATHADVGQVVAPGTPLATVYATDSIEVRLPVAKDELAFLDVSVGENDGAGPPVTLSAELSGAPRSWRGRIVRTAGAIDPRTRMLDLFARVDDPFQRNGGGGSPLPIGLFVEAEIAGKTIDGAFVLPRAALRAGRVSGVPGAGGGGDEVLVVDAAGRARFRTVDVLRTRGDEVVVSAGLDDGERVIVSALEDAVDGMRVRLAEAVAPEAAAAEPGAAGDEGEL